MCCDLPSEWPQNSSGLPLCSKMGNTLNDDRQEPEPCTVGLYPWMLWPCVNDRGESSNSEKGNMQSAIAHRAVDSHTHRVEAQLRHCLIS